MKLTTFVVLAMLLGSTAFSQTAKEEAMFNHIRKESIGGMLDYKQKLIDEGRGDTPIVHEGETYTADEFALYLWGQAVNKLGIESFKVAKALWENIYQKELSSKEKKALKEGFKSN